MLNTNENERTVGENAVRLSLAKLEIFIRPGRG